MAEVDPVDFRIRRCAVLTHGEAHVTREALTRVARVLRGCRVDLVLPDDELAKHPDQREAAMRASGTPTADAVDLVLVLGGDGTTLRALHRYLESGVPVIGINYGRVGFLTSIGAAEIETRLPEVLAGRYDRVSLPALEVTVHGERHVALNDVLVTSAVQGRMALLEWTVNGTGMGERGCDGIVISTPTGSTAYNLSAGGPVLSWGVEAMVATFIAPHALDARPLVLSRGHTVRVVSRSHGFTSRVVADGHGVATLDEGAGLEVRMAPERAVLAILRDRPFLARYRDTFSR